MSLRLKVLSFRSVHFLPFMLSAFYHYPTAGLAVRSRSCASSSLSVALQLCRALIQTPHKPHGSVDAPVHHAAVLPLCLGGKRRFTRPVPCSDPTPQREKPLTESKQQPTKRNESCPLAVAHAQKQDITTRP